jgi:hypothetical protein
MFIIIIYLLMSELLIRDISPDAVTAIENLSGINIDALARAQLLLVALGEKPSTWALAYSEEWGRDTTPKSSYEGAKQYRSVAEQAGLVAIGGACIVGDTYDDQEFEVQYLYIGTAETAATLQAAVQSQDDRLIGTALGYPQSSIDAYIAKGARLSDAQQMELAKARPNVAFANYILTPEHYDSELAIADRWAHVVETVSPTIYNDVIG